MLALVLSLQLLALIIECVIVYLLLRPVIRGAIYFPTTSRNVDIIVQFARLQPGQKVADLGSGDGKILIAFAKRGVEAHGFEINPLLVWKSRRDIRKEKLESRAFVHWQSFWKANFAPYEAVTIYGIPYIMKGLSKKLRQELKPGTRVICNVYKLPDWEIRKEENRVYLYETEGTGV